MSGFDIISMGKYIPIIRVKTTYIFRTTSTQLNIDTVYAPVTSTTDYESALRFNLRNNVTFALLWYNYSQKRLTNY